MWPIWVTVEDPALCQGYLSAVAATSGTTAFVIGNRATMQATHNAGKSWSSVKPIGDIRGDRAPVEVEFFNANEGFAVGVGFSSGKVTIWRTSNGGRNWSSSQPRIS
ncbi:MAG TPA: hypothetical protein VMQ40_06735 [Acidimicrobiales bacterium]|nr:hypothetical protein [Acidimicrobiales bacterium]